MQRTQEEQGFPVPCKFNMSSAQTSRTPPPHHPIPLRECKWTRYFRFRLIIINSILMTFGGIILFRLGTANTQHGPEAEIFAVAGAVLATLPWILQLSVSSAILISYNTGLCDLTWLVRPSHEKAPCKHPFSGSIVQDIKDSSEEDEEKDGTYRVHDAREQGFQMASIEPPPAAEYYEGALKFKALESSV